MVSVVQGSHSSTMPFYIPSSWTLLLTAYGSLDPTPTFAMKYGLGTIEHIARPCDIDFWNVGRPMRACAIVSRLYFGPKVRRSEIETMPTALLVVRRCIVFRSQSYVGDIGDIYCLQKTTALFRVMY